MRIKRTYSLLCFVFFVCTCALLGYAISHLSLKDEVLPPEAPQREEVKAIEGPPINMNFCLLLYWIFIGFGIVGMFYMILTKRGKEVLAAFIGAILAILIILGSVYLTATNISIVQKPTNASPSSGASGNTPTPSISNSPPVVAMLLIAVIFVILAIIIILVLFSFIAGRERKKVGPKQAFSVEMARVIDEGIALFETGISTRDAIIKCYRRMTELLALHGVKDALHLTPREFREEARTKLGFESEHLDSLVELFEIARYSSHEVTESDRERALRALKGLRKEVEHGGA